LVINILKTAPEVKVLITSRARLNVPGEHLIHVGGMDVPPDQDESIDAKRYSAVQLFLQSARQVQPGITPTAQDLAHIAHICRFVQGMPLGILLAAAWMQMLTPAEIAFELGQDRNTSLDFLKTDWRGIPQRHRSLRAVFDHSWRQLAVREQEILQALSVFRGGGTLEAIQRIAGASLHDLRACVNRSLLDRTTTGRYEMHELLRQYTAEKLAASPDCGKAINDRHAAYYTAASQRWAAKGHGPQQFEAYTEFETDIDNVYAAWDWIVRHKQIKRIAETIDGLNWFFEWSGRYQEAKQAYQNLVTELEEIETPSPDALRILAKGLASQAMFGRMSGMEPRQAAREQLQRALDLVQGPLMAEQDTRAERAFILKQMGDVISNYAEIQQLYRQSLNLYRELDDRSGMTDMLTSLGRIAAALSDYSEARQILEEALTICQTCGNRAGVAYLLGVLSEIAIVQGEFEDAKRLARESITICREANDRGGVRVGRKWLADALAACGEFAQARSLLQRTAREYEECGMQVEMMRTTLTLGFAQIHLGLYEQARAGLQVVLAHFSEMGDRFWVAIALQGLGELDLAEEAYGQAADRLREGAAAAVETGRPRFHSTYACLMGCKELGMGRAAQAKQHFSAALGVTLQTKVIFPALYSTALVARWMCHQGMLEQGIEYYALSSRYAYVAHSRWFEDVAGKHVAAAAATLPSDVVAAAQERGKARDLWATLDELLDELGGSLSG
jgi:predicted ATPase